MMAKMRYKYDFRTLQDRFHITKQEMEDLIRLDLLVPDNWERYSEADRSRHILEDFRRLQWSADTVERFEEIVDTLKEKHSFMYLQMNRLVDEFRYSLEKLVTQQDKKIDRAIYLINQVLVKIDERDVMITSHQFCDLTGYKHQSFLNSLEYINQEKTRARSTLGEHGQKFYYALEWTKIRRIWHTSKMHFEQIRKGFSYEAIFFERKRRGEIKSRESFDEKLSSEKYSKILKEERELNKNADNSQLKQD